MGDHSENEIYAVTCRLEKNVLDREDLNASYVCGFLDGLREIQKVLCEKVDKVPNDYAQHLITLMEE